MSERSDEQRARYEFKRALEELREVRGRGTELISLYVPPDKQIHEAMGQLRDELGQAQNIKSKSTRKNVSSALESIMSRLKTFKQPPPHGVIFLVGHKAAGGDQTRMVQFVLEPPQPIDVYLYRCDSTFFLEPMERMLMEPNVYGLLVVDRSEATIGLLKGTRVEMVTHLRSNVPSKHHAGGQSHRRFERLIEEAAYDFFKRVARHANEIFLHEENLKGILVGGPGATKVQFLEHELLNHELMKKVVDTFDTGYTDEYGLRDLVNNAQDTLRQLGLMEEKDLVQRFLREVGKHDGGLSAYGEAHVRHALRIGAVDTLLLSEDLRKARVEVACSGCDYTAVETTGNPARFEDQLGACPNCGTQLEVADRTDVIEELSDMADQTGSEVELVSSESEEGQLLKTAFGGMAAILRFHVPPPTPEQVAALTEPTGS